MNGALLLRLGLGRASLLPVGFFLIATTAIAVEQIHALKIEGLTELTLTRSNAKTVRVALWQTAVSNSYPYREALLWGGDVDALPKVLLSLITVHEDSDTIYVPLSAYSDLGDLKTASLDQVSQGFNLILHGGNTATSYDAILTFNQGNLRVGQLFFVSFPTAGKRLVTRFPHIPPSS